MKRPTKMKRATKARPPAPTSKRTGALHSIKTATAVRHEPFEGYNALVAREAWTARATTSTRFTTSEAAIVEWLIDAEHTDHRELRARFTHRLKGVESRTLDRVALLVRSICGALETGDANTLDRLARPEPHAIVRALRICERFLAEVESNALDDMGADAFALELAEAWPALVGADPDDVRTPLAKVPKRDLAAALLSEARSRSQGKRTTKTARGVLAGLMVNAKLATKRDAASRMIDGAKKTAASRKT